MSTREILPADATLVDAIYELEFRQAVEEGLTSLHRGERIPLEEARERIPQWILSLPQSCTSEGKSGDDFVGGPTKL